MRSVAELDAVRWADRLALGHFLPLYRRWYSNTEEAVKKWHAECLSEFDMGYRLHLRSMQYIEAKERAIEEGIGIFDPKYPSISDFSDPDRAKNMLNRLQSGRMPFWKGKK